MNLHYFSYRK